MVFCGLIQSYPRIHPHSVLPLRFGKRSSTIWRNFLRSADVDIRSRFSANNPVFLYKSYTTWNRNNFSFSCPVTLQRRFNVNKLGLHSSSSLLHTETTDAGKLEKDSEKHVEIHQSRTSNESSSHEDFKQHCETFQGQTQVDEILENLDMQIDNERLMNGVAADRHVVLAESSEHDFEGNSSDTGNVHSSSSQETVTLHPGKVMDFLVAFFEDKQVKKAALENGIGGRLFKQLFQEFKRKIVLQMKAGNSEMLRAFIKSYYSSDHPSKLFPLFLAFARKAHPMLNCINEVKKISDLRGPADLFPEARTIQRKIIYHAGPTNSGKTHSALERFRSAQSGVYCGPLRLLATEVFKRTNDAGIPCDLLTGEDRQWAVSPDEPADHIAATVEMCSTKKFYDCAVIDEIQMMNDGERGWAWTRALLGLPCPEIHICGENTAVDVVQRLVSSCNDEIEIHHYERLSPLQVRDNSLNGRVNRVKPGDCVVAFSQQELYRLRRDIEDKSEQKCAIIYGSLPPATKVEQASKFNDPMDECSVLVASDAIGMGLNLNIKRIVFSTLKKFNGQDLVELTPSQAKQIAGRAGRYGSDYPNGEALTFRKEDSDLFHSLMTRKAEDVKAAGLAPSTEQIEMLSQQLPDASLHKLYEVFESVVQLDGANYFMCDLEFKKKIAHKLRGIPLSIMEQYVFSTAPVSLKTIDFAAKFAVNVSCEMPLTSSGLQTLITWPPKVPKSLAQLQKLELLHEVLDLYLWLSHRFPEVFVDVEDVCQMQHRLEGVIGEAVSSGTLGVPAGQRPHPKTRFKNKIKFFKRYDFSKKRNGVHPPKSSGKLVTVALLPLPIEN